MEIDYLYDLRIEYDHYTSEIIISAYKSQIQTGTAAEIADYIRDRQSQGYVVILDGKGLHTFSTIKRAREILA